ncbi:hypothetical protein D3C78_1348810 [compost metagenome]
MNVIAAATEPPVLVNGGLPNFNWVDLVGAIPQNRPDRGRLRFEAAGFPTDPPQLTLNDVGFDVLSAAPTLRLTGVAQMWVGNKNRNSFLLIPEEIDLLPVPLGAEPGIVIGTNAAGDEIELIWPELGGDPPGNAIVRIQDNNIPADYTGEILKCTFTLRAYARDNDTDPTNDKLIYQWTRNTPVQVVVPEARLD